MISGDSIDTKIVKIGPSKCKLYYCEPACISLGLTHLLPILIYVKCVYQANPVYSMLSWAKLHFNDPSNRRYQSISKKAQKLSFYLTFDVFTILIPFISL